MNPYERAELEAEHDGFSNEYQRAHAASRYAANLKDERPLAQELANFLGEFVIVWENVRYCPATDGILGAEFLMDGQRQYATREAAEAYLAKRHDFEALDDSWPHVIGPEFLGPEAPAEDPFGDDGVPF